MSKTTDWEERYREKDTPWDKGQPAPPLLEWMEANPGKLSGAVLVPGCGMGHDVRAIVAKSGGKVTRVIGLDISPTAVSLASEFPPEGCEMFQYGDFLDLEERFQGSFDWVWEHTCFCAINPGLRKEYVEGVRKALKPGGSFLAVFYLNPYDNDHPPGEGPPHGCSLDDLKELFEKNGDFVIRESYVPGKSYPGREGLEMLVRMERTDQ